MKLREILALIGGPTMLDDRTARISGASDELFDDDTMVTYLNEAQRRLAAEAWVLEDTTTPAVCSIQLALGTTDYALHESVLGVKYVRLSDSDLDLLRVGYNDNRLHNIGPMNEPDFWDVNTPILETPGRPTRWSADVGIRVLRLRAKPDATNALLQAKLAVVRMPLVDLDAGSPDASPEVSREHHLALARFAAGSCASAANVDDAIRSKGKEWLAFFEAHVETAKRWRRRQQFSAPQVRFGGWANGRRS